MERTLKNILDGLSVILFIIGCLFFCAKDFTNADFLVTAGCFCVIALCQYIKRGLFGVEE